jgi:hypothetical protein
MWKRTAVCTRPRRDDRKRGGEEEEKQSDRYEHRSGGGLLLRGGAKTPPLLLAGFELIDNYWVTDNTNKKRKVGVEERTYPVPLLGSKRTVVIVHKITMFVFNIVSVSPETMSIKSNEDRVSDCPGDEGIPPHAERFPFHGAQHCDDALYGDKHQRPGGGVKEKGREEPHQGTAHHSFRETDAHCGHQPVLSIANNKY